MVEHRTVNITQQEVLRSSEWLAAGFTTLVTSAFKVPFSYSSVSHCKLSISSSSFDRSSLTSLSSTRTTRFDTWFLFMWFLMDLQSVAVVETLLAYRLASFSEVMGLAWLMTKHTLWRISSSVSSHAILQLASARSSKNAMWTLVWLFPFMTFLVFR